MKNLLPARAFPDHKPRMVVMYQKLSSKAGEQHEAVQQLPLAIEIRDQRKEAHELSRRLANRWTEFAGKTVPGQIRAGTARGNFNFGFREFSSSEVIL